MAELVHGRPSTYNNNGCRCVDCKEAWAAYMKPRIKSWRERKRKADPVER